MPARKSEGEVRSDMLSKIKRPDLKSGLFLYISVKPYLFTLVMYFCSAMVIDGVSGVGA